MLSVLINIIPNSFTIFLYKDVFLKILNETNEKRTKKEDKSE